MDYFSVQLQQYYCMIKRVFKLLSSSPNRVVIRYSFSTMNTFRKKLQDKQYFDILGLHGKEEQTIDNNALRRAYINQIKKYHSDNVYNEDSKKQNQEITKCIIMAYEELSKRIRKSYSADDSNQLTKDEDEVAYTLHGKKFNMIKYDLYKEGNQAMKEKFIQELEKYRRQSKAKENVGFERPKQQKKANSSYETYESTNSDSNGGKILAGIAIISLILVPFITKKKSSGSDLPEKQHKIRQYTEKQMDIVMLNTYKIQNKSLQLFLNKVLKRRPHMLQYPIKRDPFIIQQLAYYSIAPDIHLYQVESKYFLNQQEYSQLQKSSSVEHINKYRLTQTKPNSLLSLSLQAERVLQNVYIKVDDILDQIAKTGKYTPPKVFFNFFGYMMVEIRQKSFSNLLNYKNTKHISLYDLYFDYYSPIFFKRDYYTQYLVGFEQDSPQKNHRYFGHVNINRKAIPARFIENKEKVIVMKDIKKTLNLQGKLKEAEQKNRDIWEGYYAKYETSWKKYCTHQAAGQILY